MNQVLESTPVHEKDEDCLCDPETRLCLICQVEHSEPCFECGQHAFHAEGCSQSDEYMRKANIEDLVMRGE